MKLIDVHLGDQIEYFLLEEWQLENGSKLTLEIGYAGNIENDEK